MRPYFDGLSSGTGLADGNTGLVIRESGAEAADPSLDVALGAIGRLSFRCGCGVPALRINGISTGSLKDWLSEAGGVSGTYWICGTGCGAAGLRTAGSRGGRSGDVSRLMIISAGGSTGIGLLGAGFSGIRSADISRLIMISCSAGSKGFGFRPRDMVSASVGLEPLAGTIFRITLFSGGDNC